MSSPSCGLGKRTIPSPPPSQIPGSSIHRALGQNRIQTLGASWIQPEWLERSLRRAAPGVGSRRLGGKWRRTPSPCPHISSCRGPSPRRSQPQPPGLPASGPPLGAWPERRSEEARLARAGVLSRQGRGGLRDRGLQHAFLVQVAQISASSRLPRSRERLILGLDFPAAEWAKPLLHFFPFPQHLIPKRTIPGRAGPDHLCLLPLR